MAGEDGIRWKESGTVESCDPLSLTATVERQ